jgi:hypothetical protein
MLCALTAHCGAGNVEAGRCGLKNAQKSRLTFRRGSGIILFRGSVGAACRWRRERRFKDGRRVRLFTQKRLFVREGQSLPSRFGVGWFPQLR